MMTMFTPKIRTMQGCMYTPAFLINTILGTLTSEIRQENKNTHWKGRKRKYLTA